MILCKEFTFDAAHQLMNYRGKDCENLHGHTYKVQVYVKGKVQENGLVVDFFDIKKIIKENVLDLLDHKFLNDIISQPSAENICIWIWEKLVDKLSVPLYEVRVWETQTQFSIYNGE